MTRSPRPALLAALVLAAVPPSAFAVTVTRGPYLQQNTPGGIVVRWRTDVATDSRVEIGAAVGALGTSVDDPAVTTEHVVPVSGLAAYTKYYYAVGSVAGALVGDTPEHYFRTSPVPGAQVPMRFWVTGDGGFANADGMAVRDAYAGFQGGAETNLFLLLGDNAYLVGSDANYQAALFDMHAALLRHTPAWPTFGNHESASSNSLSQTGPYFDMFTLPTAGEAGGVASGTEAYFSFDYGNVHFIDLDANSAAVTPGSAMMTWLEADLQATAADWIVAFWHHPPYSRGLFHNSDVEGREIAMRENVVPLLEDYGVDLVLCGHSHNYERSWFLDGHYGFANTFDESMKVETGSGDPAGDGPYHKTAVGPTPHAGAVYVVAGSSSEVRNATLDHPAHRVGLLELGSLVMDVSGPQLTVRFLNDAGAVSDTFSIVKGPICPPAPRGGCLTAGASRLVIKNFADDSRDKVVWKWKRGTLGAGDVGTPDGETDLGVCVYDGNGLLLGSSLPRGAAGSTAWKALSSGYRYADADGMAGGIIKVKLKTGSGTAQILAKGKGPNLALPAGPQALPLRAQLVNHDASACWESVFAEARVLTAEKVVAAQ